MRSCSEQQIQRYVLFMVMLFCCSEYITLRAPLLSTPTHTHTHTHIRTHTYAHVTQHAHIHKHHHTLTCTPMHLHSETKRDF
jgi:ABC-type nickel/cobalt efflux system permease component RcnA